MSRVARSIGAALGTFALVLASSGACTLGLQSGAYATCNVAPQVSDNLPACKACVESRCCAEVGHCEDDGACAPVLADKTSCMRDLLARNSTPANVVPGWIRADCAPGAEHPASAGLDCIATSCPAECFPRRACRLDPAAASLAPTTQCRTAWEVSCCEPFNDCLADASCRLAFECMAEAGCAMQVLLELPGRSDCPACRAHPIPPALFANLSACVKSTGACTPLADASTD